MAKFYAGKGHHIEFLPEIAGISSPDTIIDGIKVDFKSLSSANNIERHAKDAIYKQGADEVWFEFDKGNDKIYEKLRKLSGIGIHGRYFVKGKNVEQSF